MKIKLLLLVIGLVGVMAVSQTTTRRNLQPKTVPAAAVADTQAAIDTVVVPAPHTIDINGYDKPLRSRRETFFATNNTKKDIESVAVTITYLDSSNRQLHERGARLPLQIPAGETRQASLKSWDQQLAFYYKRSAVPERASQATPYEVKITVDTIFYAR